MSHAARRRLLPVLALILAACSAHAQDPASRTSQDGRASDASALSLRLADGSFIRVPCDTVAASKFAHCAPSAARESASLSDGPRRAPLTRRAPIFDSNRPGVVASVRG